MLNPPPDIRYREILAQGGLFACGGLAETSIGHVFLSRHGLYRYMGSPNPEFLSETNQSILDNIENDNLDDSVVAVIGDEIWILLDTDNDGDMETVLILDLQRDVVTRQIMDRAWRQYTYDVPLNDIIVRKTGGTYRTILAADATNAYVLELNTGTTDNGLPIDCTIETHDLRGKDLIAVDAVSIDAKYVGTSVSYKVTLTDHIDREYSFQLSPTSGNDIRGHRTGCRILSPVSVRVKVESSHVVQDELLGITVEFIGR